METTTLFWLCIIGLFALIAYRRKNERAMLEAELDLGENEEKLARGVRAEYDAERVEEVRP